MKPHILLSTRRVGMSAIIAMALAAMTSDGMAQSAKFTAKARNMNAIMSDVQSKGKARVIVEFSVSAANLMSKGGLSARKAAVRSGQDAVLASTFGSVAAVSSGRSLSRMKIQPMFAIEVSLAELEKLAADSRVVGIYSDQIAKPTLIDSIKIIKAGPVHRLGGTGTGFIVGIIDTGVERTHDFIRNRVIQGACFSSNSGSFASTCQGGLTEDVGPNAGKPCTVTFICTHGTHVAGIAAGKLRNASAHPGAPRKGVAPGASIIAINVFSFSPSLGLGAFDSDIVKGLEFVFDHRNDFTGKQVASTNMSLGGGGPFTTNCDATSAETGIINALRAANIATAIASGNDGFLNGVSSPGCVSTAITVGSTDKSDVISSFSNSGALVDVLAPGTSIQSSVVGNAFQFFSGTSMATPHVAGTFAALRSLHPGATVSQIENALESTGKNILDTRPGGIHTKPRINVKGAEGVL
jgi:subtilisin family serine protease